MEDLSTQIPEELIAYATRIGIGSKWRASRIREVALSYFATLGKAKDDGLISVPMDGSGYAYLLRCQTADMEHAGFLTRVDTPEGGITYKLSAKGRTVMGLQPETGSDADAPDSSAVAQAQEIISQALAVSRVEVKTLRQDIGTPERVARADEALSEHLNAGWHILHIDYQRADTSLIRHIMLQRLAPPAPAATAPASTAATPPDPVPAETPADPPVKVRRAPLVTPVGAPLALGPWGTSILTSGLDATLQAADQRVMNVFTEAYRSTMESAQITVRALQPGGPRRD